MPSSTVCALELRGWIAKAKITRTIQFAILFAFLFLRSREASDRLHCVPQHASLPDARIESIKVTLSPGLFRDIRGKNACAERVPGFTVDSAQNPSGAHAWTVISIFEWNSFQVAALGEVGFALPWLRARLVAKLVTVSSRKVDFQLNRRVERWDRNWSCQSPNFPSDILLFMVEAFAITVYRSLRELVSRCLSRAIAPPSSGTVDHMRALTFGKVVWRDRALWGDAV